MNTKLFCWNEEKNEKLKSGRKISFDDVVAALKNGDFIDIIDNPNAVKYPSQLIIVVKINNYAVAVPFVVQADGSWFLKTIFPNRKLNKKYL